MSSTSPCERCGQVHPRCKAHNRAGAPCGNRPNQHQAVCRAHGGEAPQALAEARTRELERRARVALREAWANGEERPSANPVVELDRIAGEAVAFKDYLRGQVSDLEGLLTYWSDRDFYGRDGEVIRTESVEYVRATVAAYERALDRCGKLLANIVKLDLAGRLLELNQAKAALVVEAVRTGLGQVDMSAEVRRAAETAIGEALRNVTKQAQPQPKELTA